MHIRDRRAWDALESDIIMLTTFEFVDQFVEGGENPRNIGLTRLLHLQLEIMAVRQLLLCPDVIESPSGTTSAALDPCSK